MPRSLGTALLLFGATLASLAWLGWQATAVAAAVGMPPTRGDAELRILAGLLILAAWVLAWRRYRRSQEG